jgi:SAM-dependent methyltransferase
MGYGSSLPGLIPSFTYQPRRVSEEFVKANEGKLVVDLGAGGRKIAPWVETVDFVELPGTTHVCDFVLGRTPYADGSVDAVLSTGVLEHVEDDRLFIAEISRMLRQGGLVHIELPFMQQYHEDPIDCRRLTLPGLHLFLEKAGFEVVQSGVHIGPTVAILTLTSYWINILFRGRSKASRAAATAAFALFSIVAWPLRYLDAWLIHKPDAHRLAFGIYATARKL